MSASCRLLAFVLSLVLTLPTPLQAAVTSSFSSGTLSVASDAADSIAVACTGAGGNVQINGADPGSGALPCSQVTQLSVSGGPGANLIDIQGANFNFSALTGRTVDGGAGADSIQGSPSADILIGGADADVIDGNAGNDVALLGEGNDTFVWNPGDGSDTLEGQPGSDLLQFNGSGAIENLDFAANGGRLRVFRDIGAVIIDADDVERVEYSALGGTDTAVVNSLAGTDAAQIEIRLAGTLGGATGDALSDLVVVHGSAAADSLAADSAAGTITVTTGATVVTITTAEPANDRLTLAGNDGNDSLSVGASLAGQLQTLNADGGNGIDTVAARGTAGADALTAAAVSPFVSAGGNALIHLLATENLRLDGLGGGDMLSAVGNVAPLFNLTLDGGAGDDTLAGGNGADVLIGGSEADLLDGNQGSDVALGGDGNDEFRWDPGDGNDTLEGQAGLDALSFNGSGANENITLSANGQRLLLLRDVGAIVMDVDDVEEVDCSVVGGADNIVLNDLAGTDVTLAHVRLAGTLGGAVGDALADNVTINGSSGADVLAVDAAGGSVNVTRGAFVVSVHTAEPANDRLSINALAGDDTLSASPAVPGLVGLTLDGGAGSAMPGDIVALSGEAAAENYQIAPNGARVALTRSAPASFSIDINAMEWLQLNLADGADTVNTQGLATTSQLLDGGAPAAIPGDTLNVAGFTGDVFESPIVLPGAAPIVHGGFEQTTNPLVIESFLSGAQETPRNPSLGRGFGTVTLNGARDSILVFLEYSGLGGSNTLVHIHGPAARGVAASPIIDLPASGSSSGMFTVGPLAITPTQRAQLMAGLWYFNVHSTAPGSSGGEIRGQIDDSQFRDGFE